MASVNKVILVGNVGREPELRVTPSGLSVANFSLATTEKYKDKSSGNVEESTEWHNCVVFGTLADSVMKYVTKGQQMYIEGSINTNKYKDANGVEKYSTKIRVNTYIMLGGKPAISKPATTAEDYQRAKEGANIDPDIPF